MPAAISAVLRLSGGRSGVGEGDGPRNRRAAVHRLGRCMPRSRVCSSSECGGGARFSSLSSTAAELNNCSMAATLLWELLFLIADGVVRILVLRGESGEFCFSGRSVRLVVSLFAKGLDLLCPPVGLHFRVGAFVAGRGSCSTLLLPSERSPILVQRFRSILAGAPRWWLMRLYQGLRSSGGGGRVSGFVCASTTQPSGAKSMMNRTPRDQSVIFFFYGVLCKTVGMYCVPALI